MAQNFDETWDPEYQFGNPIPPVASREEYEHACALVGILPSTDAQIGRNTYGLTYAEYHKAAWAALGRERRVQWLLDSGRMRALRAQAQALRELKAQAQATTATPTLQARWGQHGTRYDEACAVCGRQGEVDNDTSACRACSYRSRLARRIP